MPTRLCPHHHSQPEAWNPSHSVSGTAELFFVILTLCAKAKRSDKLLAFDIFFLLSPCQGPLGQ